jgi:protein-S-isoprenylcysteine O-methyltransferase Ste14
VKDLRNLFKQMASFLLPFMAIVVIPFFILDGAVFHFIYELNVLSLCVFVLGMMLVIFGFYILVLTVRTFIIIGKGTLAPWSPTRHLIVGGVYGYVRNPMISGVFFFCSASRSCMVLGG